MTDPVFAHSVGVQSVMEDVARRHEAGEELPEVELRAIEADLTGRVSIGRSVTCIVASADAWSGIDPTDPPGLVEIHAL